MDVNDTVIDQQVPAPEAPVEQKEAPQADPPKGISQEEIDAIQKKSFGYAFNMVDSTLKEAGYEKPEGVKTTDYLKEILSKGTKKEEVSVKDTSTNDLDSSAKIKQLQDQLREKEAVLLQMEQSTSKQKRDFFLNSVLDSAEISAPEHLEEAERKRYIDRVKRTMRSELEEKYQVKEVDNSFRFYTKDNEPLFDGTIDMNHLSANELIKREFSEFLRGKEVAKTTVKGTGVAVDSKPQSQAVVPSTIKTRDDLYSYVQNELGYTLGSKEMLDFIGKAKNERPTLFK